MRALSILQAASRWWSRNLTSSKDQFERIYFSENSMTRSSMRRLQQLVVFLVISLNLLEEISHLSV